MNQMIYWILGLAAIMRLLHLANGNHFIISPDSHYFYMQAEKIAAGASVPVRESGIAYLISWGDSLWWNSVFWPVFFGVLSTALLYLVVEKMWNKRTAITSAFCFAIAIPAIFQQAAGNIDRDCLHLLLIGVCTFAIYYAYDRPKTAGLLLVGAMALMWYEWGQIALAVIVVGTVAAPFLVIDNIVFTHSWRKAAIPLGVILVLLIGVVVWSGLGERFSALGPNISELAPLDGREFLGYLALIPALIVGVLCLAKRKTFTRADLFLVCWLLVTLALGLISRRLWAFSVPAYCVLGGIGLAWVWKKRLVPKIALVGLAVLMVGFSGYYAFHLDMGDPRSSATPEMQEAMEWIRENTAADAQILAWWDWGYMIEDLSGRPVSMNNGSHAQGRMKVTWEALQGTGDDSEVRIALRQTDSDYLLIYHGYPPSTDNTAFCERVFSPCGCDIGSGLRRVYLSEHIAIVTRR